jgi:hypothetical protein
MITGGNGMGSRSVGFRQILQNVHPEHLQSLRKEDLSLLNESPLLWV